jgi:hypothetical protein
MTKLDSLKAARPNTALWSAVAVLVILKIGALIAYGPVMTPDSYGYVGYAKAILRSNSWLYDAQLDSSPMPLLAFRIVGYPLFLAGAMAIGGAYWAYVAVVIQSVVSVISMVMIFRLGLSLRLSQWVSAFGALAFVTSFQFKLDQCILTDSLHASCIIIGLTLVANSILKNRAIEIGTAAIVGLLFVAAFLLRDVLQFLVVLFIPLLIAGICATRSGRRWRSIAACFLIVAPLFGAAMAYKAWNVYRTGSSFTSTAGQAAPLYALILAAQKDPDIFSGNTPLDIMFRRMMYPRNPDDWAAINGALFKEGYRAPELARMITAHFFATWKERPLSMVAMLRDSISENALKMALRPITAICETGEWANNHRVCYDYRVSYRQLMRRPFSLGPLELIALLGVTVQNFLSIVIFTLFLIGIPVLAIRSLWRRDFGPEPLVLAGFWASYIGWYLAYAVTVLDDRYIMPMIPFSIIGGLYIATDIMRRRAERKHVCA